MPYGNRSFADPQHLGYLTSEQALADYVKLIGYLRSQPGYKRSPVIAFGGSYGGMLSAWMRMKYPHIIQGYVLSLDHSGISHKYTKHIYLSSTNKILLIYIILLFNFYLFGIKYREM